MEFRTGMVLGVLICAVAIVGPAPAGTPPYPIRAIDFDSNARGTPPLPLDGDRDGYYIPVDCNDDDPLVHPSNEEMDNGIDDDCNGVVDDGFDTSVDWPTVRDVRMLWPDNKASRPEELISVDESPRVVSMGKYFAAVWSDRGGRLRLARFGTDGTLVDDPPLTLTEKVRHPDVAWTGTRFGIVYEDVSAMLPNVRLMTVDVFGKPIVDLELAKNSGNPVIAWGRDRFGVVWQVGACAGDCLSFRKFDRYGRALDSVEALESSGSHAAIAFSGSGQADELEALASIQKKDGSFAIAYQAYYAFSATTDVRLAIRPLDSYETPATIRVNEHDHAYSKEGPLPSIAGSAAGFAVCWHEMTDGKDGARARLVSLDGVAPVPELVPDADEGRASRIVWTGSEFIAVNDNRIKEDVMDVHLRRLDPSGNSQLAAGWGPWRELNLSDQTPGTGSSNPDVALYGAAFGVVWVERETTDPGFGRIWFASVVHR